MKKRAKHSLKSRNVKRKDNADSSNSSARCFCSSGSSCFSPYQISHLESKGLNTKEACPGTRDGPDVDTMSPSRTRFRAVGSPDRRKNSSFGVWYFTKPNIRASEPEEDLKYACTRIRSELSLPTKALASASEMRPTGGNHITGRSRFQIRGPGPSTPDGPLPKFKLTPCRNVCWTCQPAGSPKRRQIGHSKRRTRTRPAHSDGRRREAMLRRWPPGKTVRIKIRCVRQPPPRG